MAPKFNELVIKSTRTLQGGAIALRFDVPEALDAHYRFTPGQYVTLRHTINGEDVRRSYSICSSLQSAGFEVGIKKVEGGAFSSFAHQLQPGNKLNVMTPQGRFNAELGGRHHYLCIAAGSGITPCLSIIKSVLEGEPNSKITLIYGNSNSQSVMFREDIDALKDTFTTRFLLTHIISQQQQDVAFQYGRIDAAKVQELVGLGIIKPDSYDAAFICGPQTMMEQSQNVLLNSGMSQAQVFTELFVTDAAVAAAMKAAPNNSDVDTTDAKASLEPQGDATPVHIILDGVRNQFLVNAEQETVLSAAKRVGIELPFSCAGGMCCTCRCKVLEGDAKMDLNYSLQQWEIDAGFTLACQARPQSDTLVLDFDAT